MPAPGAPASVVISGGLGTSGLLTCTPTAAAVVYGVSGPTTGWTYQWWRGAGQIAGATASTYLATALDSGTDTTCVATPSNPVWGAGASGTSNIIVVPAIAAWTDQSATARTYQQAVAADKPKADSGTTLFDSSDGLVADGTAMGAGGACTVIERFQLTTVPGAGWRTVGLDVTAAGALARLSECAGAGGYQPYTFVNRTAFAVCVGIADALDLAVHTLLWTEDGAGIYTARLDGVAKPVVASGLHGFGSFVNALGYGDAAGRSLGGALWSRVVYDGVLSAADQLAAETLIADPASTYAQYAALGTVALCVLQGVGWA